MAWELVVAHAVLPMAVASASTYGAWRCAALLRYGRDPRLLKLAWFYGLFAASLVPWAVWIGQASLSGDLAAMHSTNATVRHYTSGPERVDGFLAAHHALMLASLGIAVQAFSHKPRAAAPVALASLAFLSPFIPVVLALEAALALYLAVRAILNHLERRSAGALQVAAGFLLFFLGHLSFFLFHDPGSGRTPLGDVLALVGIVTLVQLLPRPTA